jgi:hypothetical protein
VYTLFLLYVLTFCRFALSLLFAAAFITKVRNIPQFVQTITQFDLLPVSLSRPVAHMFLVGEFVAAGCLVAGGPFLAPGFLLTLGLLLLFTGALSWVLLHQIPTSCNCFGSQSQHVSRLELGRNSTLLLCALVGWVVQTNLSTQGSQLSPAEMMVVGLAAALFGAVWINLNEIRHLFRQ